jgi:hypothetical protein
LNAPDELVEIWGATRHNSALSTSYLDYLDFRDRNGTFSGLFAHQILPLNLGRGEKPERVRGAVVSGNYFDVLGVKALIGRTFAPEPSPYHARNLSASASSAHPNVASMQLHSGLVACL